MLLMEVSGLLSGRAAQAVLSSLSFQGQSYLKFYLSLHGIKLFFPLTLQKARLAVLGIGQCTFSLIFAVVKLKKNQFSK